MRVREMRASQRFLSANVEVGQQNNGSSVTVQVKIDRTTDEAKSAFVLLDNLLLREAQTAVDEAQRNTERRRREAEQAEPDTVVQTSGGTTVAMKAG